MGETTYLPSIVFGWAVKSAGSKIKRVLSTTSVIRSSLCPEVVVEFRVEVDPDKESLSWCLSLCRSLPGECPWLI